MSGSKIIEALVKFKSDYAWDKSLVADSVTRPAAPPVGFDPLERFNELSREALSE